MNRIALGLLLILVFAAPLGAQSTISSKDKVAKTKLRSARTINTTPQGTVEAQQQKGVAQPERRALDDFQLPPKTVFDKAMPRYPNVWFYLDTRLAKSYEAAVKLITNNLRSSMLLRESYGPFDNPEGCDFEVTLEHLQPWIVREHRALQHAHAFHMRYYFTALARSKLETVKLVTAKGERAYYRFGASVHYEVEHSNPTMPMSKFAPSVDVPANMQN